MKYRKTVTGISLFIVVIIAVFVGTKLLGGTKAPAATATTAVVTKGTIHTTLNATGTIISASQADLSFDVSGTLTEIHVSLNQAVAVDQTLAVLEPTTGAGDETLTSTIAGTVIHIGAKTGDKVGTTSSSAGDSGVSGSAAIETTGLVTVADLNNLQVKLGVDQADIAKLSANQAVEIALDAIPDKIFTGAIVYIDPIPTNNSNVITYTVYVSLVNPEARVRLGMSANVSVGLGKKENVLIVPNLAVKTVNGKKTVTRVVTGKQTDVNVTVGESDDKNTEIISGIAEGDKVVIGEVTATSSSGGGGFGG